MGPTQRGAVFVLTVVAVLVVGVLGVSAIRSPQEETWPGRVAVIGIDEDDRRQPISYFGIADPVRQAVVSVPPEAVVEIPGAGFLRAYHAWRLGDAPLVRRTLGRLFGVDVPFSVVGTGDTFEEVARSFTTAEIKADDVDALRRALESEAAGWRSLEVTGEEMQGDQGTYVVPSPGSVAEAARAIGGLGTRVFVDPGEVDAIEDEGQRPAASRSSSPLPAASPAVLGEARIDPSTVGVDVLNAGEVEMAATRTASELEELGYDITRIADHRPQDRSTSVVYFREGADAEGLQVGADLGYPVEPLPDGIPIKAAAEVVVVLGHDAQV